jgi:hypothetical protein
MQIKTNYETQLSINPMLKEEIKKKLIKKRAKNKMIIVNLQNS